MSTTRALAHNTLIQFIGKAVGTVLALFASTLLFRYLGPSEYGKFHIILTIVQLSGIIGDLGLYLIVLNDISHPKRESNHVLSQHFMFRMYLNAMYLLIMAAVLITCSGVIIFLAFFNIWRLALSMPKCIWWQPAFFINSAICLSIVSTLE